MPQLCYLCIFVILFCRLCIIVSTHIYVVRVYRHRWTGRYEAHLWDNSCKKEGQTRRGRQGQKKQIQNNFPIQYAIMHQ